MTTTMTTEEYQRLPDSIKQRGAGRATKQKKIKPSAASESEDKLQERVADFLRENYPDVIFDANSKNIKMSVQKGAQMKRMGKAKSWPDMFIAEARQGYHGLFIELKKEGERIFQVNQPKKYANEHVEAQAEMHKQLRARGYKAVFAVGYQQAIDVIRGYLGE